MALLDVLSGVGTVVSPGLEAYGQGRMQTESLRASLLNRLLSNLLEREKQKEQARQFGITSGLEQSKLAELIRHNKETADIARAKAGKLSPLELLMIQSNPDLAQRLGITNPPLSTINTATEGPNIFNRLSGGLDRAGEALEGLIYGQESGATPILPSTPESPRVGKKTGLNIRDWIAEAIKAPVSSEDLIKGFKAEFDATDAEVKSYFSQIAPSTPSPNITPTLPVEKGEVGIGPSNIPPTGFLESFRGGPLDVQQYLPPKEEVPGYLQRFLENRRGGPLDVQQYIPRSKGYRIPQRTLGQ